MSSENHHQPRVPVRRRQPDGDLLVPVMERRQPRPAAPVPQAPQMPWLFAVAMAVALSLAATAGMGLAVLVALENWTGPTN